MNSNQEFYFSRGWTKIGKTMVKTSLFEVQQLVTMAKEVEKDGDPVIDSSAATSKTLCDNSVSWMENNINWLLEKGWKLDGQVRMEMSLFDIHFIADLVKPKGAQ
jgi:hypothetical protein